MTNFWTYYVLVLVVIMIVGSTWLLWSTSKKRHSGDTQSSTETTGHVWDGDLSEYNKPLPRWWIILFYLTIVFAIGYLVYYPSAENTQGMANWSSKSEHDAAKAKADEKLQALYARFEGQGIDRIAMDPAALTTGKQIFANNCATCHGSDAARCERLPQPQRQHLEIRRHAGRHRDHHHRRRQRRGRPLGAHAADGGRAGLRSGRHRNRGLCSEPVRHESR